MRKVWLACFLLFVLACSSKDNTTGLVISTISEQQPNQSAAEPNITVTETIPPDPCLNVVCGENERCLEGKCFCTENFKQCGTTCIPENTCCSDSDCKDRESCVQGTCTQTAFCSFNQKWDSEKRKCICDQHTKWCSVQSKCVPFDNCCDINDCNIPGLVEKRCMPTVWEVDICLEGIGELSGKHCRKIREFIRNGFNIETNTYDLFLENAYENKELDLKLTHKGTEEALKKIEMGKQQNTNFNVTLTYNSIVSRGGNCDEG